jgi:kynurenine formamidase
MFIDTLLHTKQTKGIFTQHRLRRLAFFVGILSVLTLGCMTQEKEFPNGTIIDLSHAFDETTIFWPTEEGFKLEKEFAGLTDKGYYYAANKLCTAEHGGTHIDAPIHFAEGRMSVDQIPLEQLIGKAVVIDVSSQCENNADYQVGVSDIESWEKSNGTVPTKSIVIFRTGYSKRWPDRKSYMGTEVRVQ